MPEETLDPVFPPAYFKQESQNLDNKRYKKLMAVQATHLYYRQPDTYNRIHNLVYSAVLPESYD